jgi:hypothetical protein
MAKKKARLGRPAEIVEPLPRLSPIVVDAIAEMLMVDKHMCRRPEKTAALLALVVELDKTKRPFPPRAAVAEAIDSSIFTVDSAISQRIDEGYLQEVHETTTGNVNRRTSTVRCRYLVPSPRLVSVVRRAERVGNR